MQDTSDLLVVGLVRWFILHSPTVRKNRVTINCSLVWCSGQDDLSCAFLSMGRNRENWFLSRFRWRLSQDALGREMKTIGSESIRCKKPLSTLSYTNWPPRNRSFHVFHCSFYVCVCKPHLDIFDEISSMNDGCHVPGLAARTSHRLAFFLLLSINRSKQTLCEDFRMELAVLNQSLVICPKVIIGQTYSKKIRPVPASTQKCAFQRRLTGLPSGNLEKN